MKGSQLPHLQPVTPGSFELPLKLKLQRDADTMYNVG